MLYLSGRLDLCFVKIQPMLGVSLRVDSDAKLRM